MDEKRLIEKCKAGDLDAFGILVEQNQKRVFNIALRLFGNVDDANDVSQEVFLKVYKSLSSFKGNSTFSTWLYRIATNVALDELRKRNKNKVVSLDSTIEADENSFTRQIEDKNYRPDELYEKSEFRGEVKRAISQLKDDHRMVIILRDIEGLSYDDIAKIMDCSIGTVKSRINRARQNLKTLLTQEQNIYINYGV